MPKLPKNRQVRKSAGFILSVSVFISVLPSPRALAARDDGLDRGYPDASADHLVSFVVFACIALLREIDFSENLEGNFTRHILKA